MSAFTFELILNRELDDRELDAAFEAGLDDGTFGATHSKPTVAFDREAETLADAVISAIGQLEGATSGVRVLRVVNPEVVTLPIIADLTGRSRQNIYQLATGKRGRGGWPEPINPEVNPKHRLWRFTEIVEWWCRHEPEGPINAERAHTLAAINARLNAREELTHLPKPISRKISALAA